MGTQTSIFHVRCVDADSVGAVSQAYPSAWSSVALPVNSRSCFDYSALQIQVFLVQVSKHTQPPAHGRARRRCRPVGRLSGTENPGHRRICFLPALGADVRQKRRPGRKGWEGFPAAELRLPARVGSAPAVPLRSGRWLLGPCSGVLQPGSRAGTRAGQTGLPAHSKGSRTCG